MTGGCDASIRFGSQLSLPISKAQHEPLDRTLSLSLCDLLAAN